MQAIWPHVEGYFQSFAQRAEGELSAGQLLHDVIQGRRQCWIAVEGAEVMACALTEVAGPDNPKRTVTLNFCAGRDRDRWRDLVVGEIEMWAQEAMGSKRLRIICRPGWTKELKAMGYRETHRVLERGLADG